MIQLVVSDIDGTLLPYGETSLSEEIFTLIHRLRERGIPFCPTSGRQYHSIRTLFSSMADELPYICENGGVVYGPGTEEDAPMLASISMDRTSALALAQEILELPGCHLMVNGARYAYFCQCTPEYVELMRDVNGFDVKVVDQLDEIHEEILKVSAYCPMGTAFAAERLGPVWNGVFQMAAAGNDWLDFTIADKGKGIVELCRVMGISPEHVLAFGDNWNDTAMLSMVGHPYLMSSAQPELLAKFPTTCHRVEDVLTHFLDTNQLP